VEQPLPLDAVLHQPIRTMLVARLAGRGPATFTELKRALGLTDGNLDAHLRKLAAAGYISTSADESTGRPRTVFRLSEAGDTAVRAYFQRLSELQRFANGQAPQRPGELRSEAPGAEARGRGAGTDV
jgi:predicted ArsR family transcriptional regulator